MVKAIFYPNADRTVRWRGNGNATLSEINKIVLHTTESSALPSYSGNWPNLTYDPKTRRWYEHTPINGSATALRNDGAHQTNRANVVQVEIIGFAKNSGLLPKTAIDDLGAFVAWMHKEWNVPVIALAKWTGPNTTARLSWTTYANFKGVLGHQHVPGNEHWDPGLIDAQGIMAAANLVLHPPQPPKPPTPPAPTHTYTVVAGDTYYGIARKLKVNVADLQQANPTIPANALRPGQVLTVPGPTPPTPPAPPKPVKYKEFPFTVTHFNILKPSFADKNDLPWVKRLPLIIKHLKDSHSSVFILNECGSSEAAVIAKEMGTSWTWDRLVNNVILRDKNKWTEVKLIEKYLSGPTTGNRRTLMAVSLRYYRDRNLVVTFGSSHFEVLAAGYVKTEAQAQALRDKQTQEVVSALGKPLLTIWAADTNDRDVTSGPVAIAKRAGYKLVDEAVKVSGPKWSTDSKKLIDRVFVSPDIKVTAAHRTDPGQASDHLLTTVNVVARLAIP